MNLSDASIGIFQLLNLLHQPTVQVSRSQAFRLPRGLIRTVRRGDSPGWQCGADPDGPSTPRPSLRFYILALVTPPRECPWCFPPNPQMASIEKRKITNIGDNDMHYTTYLRWFWCTGEFLGTVSGSGCATCLHTMLEFSRHRKDRAAPWTGNDRLSRYS